MTKLRMKQQMSGSRNGVPWPAVGETFDVDPNEAATLTAGQTPIAEYIEDVDSTVPPAEVPADTTATPGPAATAAAKATTRASRATTAGKATPASPAGKK